jgi:hypothetical protein
MIKNIRVKLLLLFETCVSVSSEYVSIQNCLASLYDEWGFFTVVIVRILNLYRMSCIQVENVYALASNLKIV